MNFTAANAVSSLECADVSVWMPIFVAAVAVGIAVWQGIAQREHNRLSVKPHLDFHRIFAFPLPYSVGILNSGIGPALVKSITLSYEGETFDGTTREGLDALMERMGLKDSASMRVIKFACGAKYAMRAGEEIKFYSCKFNGGDESDYIDERAILERVQAVATYSSFYGIEDDMNSGEY